MTKDEDFKLLKIQTYFLRVNLHCDGCKHKVKKILQKIEGVYQVNVDAEQQKVTVSGSVDSATLIKKLFRAGKHAELWSNKSNQNQNHNQSQNQKVSCMKDDKKNKSQKPDFLKTLESLKNNQKFQPLISEEDDEDDDYLDDDEDNDEVNESELRLLTQKANQIVLLRQQQQQLQQQQHLQQQHAAAVAANNARNPNNNGKPVNGNGKKGSGNNNNNGGGVNISFGEGKKVNDISSVKNNLANGGGGGGGNNLGGFQMPQMNSGVGSGAGEFHSGVAGGHNPSIMTMNGGGSMYNNHQQQQQYNNSAASIMMNLQNRQAMQQQQQPPQMMYHRAPVMTPTTGYYYNSNPAPYTFNEYPQNYYYTNANGGGDTSAAHMFSDENTSSCSIM